MIKHWIDALRPKTLPASLSPVIAGIALAFREGGFRLWPALCAAAGALLLQIAVNLANDYFDYKKGVDTEDRIGPARAAASGLISERSLLRGLFFVILLSVLNGIALFFLSGWPVLVIGSASVISLLLYSGGPFPLASHGLGDIFVFAFFGPMAVCGTFYVQAMHFSFEALFYSIPVGMLITAILVVNNYRDIKTDNAAGKRTLAVRLGYTGSQAEYGFLVFMPFVLVLYRVVSGGPGMIMITLVLLPFAVFLLARFIALKNSPALNKILAATSLLAVFFSILLGAGLML